MWLSYAACTEIEASSPCVTKNSNAFMQHKWLFLTATFSHSRMLNIWNCSKEKNSLDLNEFPVKNKAKQVTHRIQVWWSLILRAWVKQAPPSLPVTQHPTRVICHQLEMINLHEKVHKLNKTYHTTCLWTTHSLSLLQTNPCCNAVSPAVHTLFIQHYFCIQRLKYSSSSQGRKKRELLFASQGCQHQV